MNLTLKLLPGELTIVRLPPDAPVPVWLEPWPERWSGPLTSITRTAEELSVICPSGSVPSQVEGQPGWRAFTVEGKLDFSAVGILASILNPLAEAGINILSISTFNTDYVLVPASKVQTAVTVLREKFELLE